MDETDSQDALLIRGISQGNVKAFESLFLKYYPRFYPFILRLVKDEWVAEDIAQNTFMKVWLHREALKEEQSIQAYLYVISKYEIYNHFRSKRTQIVDRFVNGVHDNIIPIDDTEENLDYEELQHAIRHAIESIPPRRREIFKMSRFQHLSAKEIADITGLSVRTVEKHIELALRDLRGKLSAFMFFALVFIEMQHCCV